MITGLIEIFESMPNGTKIAVVSLIIFCFAGAFMNKGNGGNGGTSKSTPKEPTSEKTVGPGIK